MPIPVEELRRTEARCNLLLSAQADYHHLLRSVEANYGVKIREQMFRSIVHGSTGPLEMGSNV